MTSSEQNKKMWSWVLYDWANSAYSTTVMAGFFPVFFKQFWSHGADSVVTTTRLGTALSISSLMIAILSPFLGALSDQKGLKKFFCGLFMILGALSCFWLSIIPQGGWVMAMISFGVGMFAFSASAVFYDALLPSVASDEQMDRVSSIGYAMGYLGGGVLFLLNVILFLKWDFFGLTSQIQAVQWSFASVGIWWILFAIPLFKNVPEPTNGPTPEKNYFVVLKNTIAKVVQDRNLFLFLLAYWLYIDGVYTVMTMAVDFGLSIGLESKDLISALLLVQFIGFPTTWFFGNFASHWGSKKIILLCIGIYSVTVCLATFMTQAWHFYLLAAVIGSVQGGVQSLSRSLFAKMIPRESAGEYYGLFNLVGKFGAILGPIFVASLVSITENSRLGMAGLLVLFVVGGTLLLRVRD